MLFFDLEMDSVTIVYCLLKKNGPFSQVIALHCLKLDTMWGITLQRQSVIMT